VGATYLYGWARDDEHARQTGILGAEAFANTILPHIAMNLVFGRQRPYEGTGESFGEGEFFANHKTGSSFPSGHCLYTWSMASVLASEYPSAPNQILWYGVGTTVAITRVTAREHWVSDVIVGSAIGYLIGRHIWRVHSRHIE
jgi:membrane-associated phospholipid phosphatase